MKKFFLMLQLAALTAGSSAFALTGGPFENSDAGILLERGGFYQTSYSYRNGNGYSIWTADNQLFDVTGFGTGDLFTPATAVSGSHNGNRTVLYYKGVTYFGSAMGSVDLDAREIQGFANASSEFSFTTVQQQTQNNFITSQVSTLVNSDVVVQSGRGYTANIGWTGKIYDRAPILRFKGKGELFIISQNGSESVASLANSAFTQLIGAIVTNVASSGGQLQTGALFGQAQVAIANALSGFPGIDVNGNGVFTDAGDTAPAPGLQQYINNSGPSANYEQGERQRVRVKGLRRFF